MASASPPRGEAAAQRRVRGGRGTAGKSQNKPLPLPSPLWGEGGASGRAASGARRQAWHWLQAGAVARRLGRRLRLRRLDWRAVQRRLTAQYALQVLAVERLDLDQCAGDVVQYRAMLGDDANG